MPGVEALRICDLPSVYDKGAPARSEATPCMPTNSGSTRPLQARKYHKQLQDRQGEMIQHVNVQNALYSGLPRSNPETWDNGLVQYTNGM